MSALAAALLLLGQRGLVIVDERATRVEEPPPHGRIGMSTAYRISDQVPQPRRMEFRRRILHRGAAIGLHPIKHDEVYYVLSGTGDVTANGETRRIGAGMTAYLYDGQNVGIRQVGKQPLSLIIAYPVEK